MAKWRILLVFLLALLVVTSCAKTPTRKPGEQQLKAPKQEPTISLYIKETGSKEQIKLEEYLAGVVAAEMEPTWPVNALAAQAMVARTFTMENIASGRIQKLHGTDASNDVEEFQAYDPSRINDHVRQAVAMTRGKVITHQGNYVKGWFSACCGGISASASEGLAYDQQPTEYIKAGARDNCLAITTPENKFWRARLPVDQVRQALAQKTGNDPGIISQVQITEQGPSGRVTKLQIGSQTISGPEFRLALGSEIVRSTLISRVDIQGNELVLEGRGFGHGVGLCQWGSKMLAEKGQQPEQIVKFFYRDVKIEKLWD